MPDSTNPDLLNKKNENLFSGLFASSNDTLLVSSAKGVRLASLDFYRGLIMILLMIESTGLYEHLLSMSTPGSFLHSLSIQFTHYPVSYTHLRAHETGRNLV